METSRSLKASESRHQGTSETCSRAQADRDPCCRERWRRMTGFRRLQGKLWNAIEPSMHAWAERGKQQDQEQVLGLRGKPDWRGVDHKPLEQETNDGRKPWLLCLNGTSAPCVCMYRHKHSNAEDQSQPDRADLVPSLTRRVKWTFSPQGRHLWGLRTHWGIRGGPLECGILTTCLKEFPNQAEKWKAGVRGDPQAWLLEGNV